MNEYPILFSGPMIPLIQSGQKTQTRRVIRFSHASDVHAIRDDVQPIGNKWLFACDGDEAREDNIFSCVVACPYGQPGDLLVPRTTWAVHRRYDNRRPTELSPNVRVWSYWDSPEKPAWCGKSRPGRFLPKKFWHLLPRLVNEAIRVERVQDISFADINAEGIHGDVYGEELSLCPIEEERSARIYFAELWDSINAKRGYGFDTNPWVWAITFEAHP